MSAISLRLPDSLHRSVRAMALKEHVSINQMITLALGEKMSALMTEDYLASRAKKGSKAKFMKALAKVPKVAPELRDKL